MRHCLFKASLVDSLTSRVVNTSFRALLIPLVSFFQRPPSPTLSASLATISVAVITRSAQNRQLIAARIGTREYAGAVVLHASLAKETGQDALESATLSLVVVHDGTEGPSFHLGPSFLWLTSQFLKKYAKQQYIYRISIDSGGTQLRFLPSLSDCTLPPTGTILYRHAAAGNGV